MTRQFSTPSSIDALYAEQAPHFRHWEKTKDIVDQCIDMLLNYRQSGHPGGSRSKVHAMLVTLLGGVMRWDIRHPEKRFGDRFVLVAGHCTPLLYSVLAVLNESLRILHRQTGEERYRVPNAEERALYWQDLLQFRRQGGLPGHAEMQGKTLFVKANTGPSGHGSPPAAGIAMALKRAGADGVRVFAFEGEGGLTAGSAHESKNSAWGLGLDNLVYCLDWNDFGIDPRPASAVVHGTPDDWFRPYWEQWHWPVVNAWISVLGGSDPVLAENVALEQEGWVDHQAHGVVHNIPMSDGSADEFLTGELQGSITNIQEYFKKTPMAIIWPGGGFGVRPVQFARKFGYRLGFTVNPRGPVMYNWVPLADQQDPGQPLYIPEGPVNDPRMVLPRYWPSQVLPSLDSVRIMGEEAAALAQQDRATEMSYYNIVCAGTYGPIP